MVAAIEPGGTSRQESAPAAMSVWAKRTCEAKVAKAVMEGFMYGLGCHSTAEDRRVSSEMAWGRSRSNCHNSMSRPALLSATVSASWRILDKENTWIAGIGNEEGSRRLKAVPNSDRGRSSRGNTSGDTRHATEFGSSDEATALSTLAVT